MKMGRRLRCSMLISAVSKACLRISKRTGTLAILTATLSPWRSIWFQQEGADFSFFAGKEPLPEGAVIIRDAS